MLVVDSQDNLQERVSKMSLSEQFAQITALI